MKRRVLPYIWVCLVGLVVVHPLPSAAQAQVPFMTSERSTPSPAKEAPDKLGAGTAKAIKLLPVDSKRPMTRPGPAKNTPDGKDEGTAQRGTCPQVAQDDLEGFELTLLSSTVALKEAAPVLWFDLKYPQGSPETPLVAEVSVEDVDTDQRLLPKVVSVELPLQSRQFGLKLPYQLERDRTYRWYVYLDCSVGENKTKQLPLEGNIQFSTLTEAQTDAPTAAQGGR